MSLCQYVTPHVARQTRWPADIRTLAQSRISRGRLMCSGCTMWQVHTAAETPSAKVEYDDRKRPKPKVWPNNYFYIRPKPNIGRICTTAHIRPPKPKPNFGRPLAKTCSLDEGRIYRQYRPSSRRYTLL